MIRGISQARDFERLRAQGRPVRVGPLRIRFLADPALDAPRVAYAIGRRYGPAVERNRLRRRLRHLLDAADRARRLVPGWYLVSVEPSGEPMSWSQARDLVETAVRRLEAS